MAILLDSLALPDDLLWQDEFDWSPVLGNKGRTLQGRLTIQTTAAPDASGRPITLGNEHAWITRADLLTLQSWASEPDRRMALTLHDGSTRTVLFRHWDAPVIEATAVLDYADPDDATLYRLLALKLVTP